jgi:hypothetical protein
MRKCGAARSHFTATAYIFFRRPPARCFVSLTLASWLR